MIDFWTNCEFDGFDGFNVVEFKLEVVQRPLPPPPLYNGRQVSQPGG